MIQHVLSWVVALSVAAAIGQTADGQIAGRINEKAGAPLPGVRITSTSGGQSREAITDTDGRFVLLSAVRRNGAEPVQHKDRY